MLRDIEYHVKPAWLLQPGDVVIYANGNRTVAYVTPVHFTASKYQPHKKYKCVKVFWKGRGGRHRADLKDRPSPRIFQPNDVVYIVGPRR